MFFFSIFDDHSQLSSPLGCWISGEGHPGPQRPRQGATAWARDSIHLPKLARSWLPTELGSESARRWPRRGRRAEHHGSAPGGSPISCPPVFAISIHLRIWDPSYVLRSRSSSDLISPGNFAADLVLVIGLRLPSSGLDSDPFRGFPWQFLNLSYARGLVWHLAWDLS